MRESEFDQLYRDGPEKYGRRFRADTAALRQWLGRRKGSLEDVRRHFEPLWREIRLYFEPNIGRALLDGRDRDALAARREDDKILNSEPRLCVERYAAGMQSGITNKALPWLAIIVKGAEGDHGFSPGVNQWCATATSEILAALERGNFYRASGLVYQHAALLGTSCVLILRGDDPGDVHFHLIDEGDYWIAEDNYGEVCTLMRRMSMTVAEAADEFGRAALPEAWRDKVDEGGEEERVEVWNLICRNDERELFRDVPGDRPYASIYWLPSAGGDNDGILDVRSFRYRPFAVMRQKAGGSAYGSGIGEATLADCKELQEYEEHLSRMIANEAMPPMLAPSSMKGRPVNSFPGGLTYYDGSYGNPGFPVRRLFETREGIDKVDAKIRGISDRIGRFWYNDLFALMLQINAGNRTQKTATEIQELSGEKVTLLGPILTQMDDFLNGVAEAVFMILYADGFIPEAPRELREGDFGISVEYTSAIHCEMKAAEKMRSINTMINMAALLAQSKPEVLDKINSDKIVDEIARIYPGAAEFIYDDDEAAGIRRQRARERQLQDGRRQFAEMAKTAGQNAKALSETRVGNGSALDALMAGGY